VVLPPEVWATKVLPPGAVADLPRDAVLVLLLVRLLGQVPRRGLVPRQVPVQVPVPDLVLLVRVLLPADENPAWAFPTRRFAK
jgi:hypothetical protein